jgi:hypothetical protein
VSQPLIEEAAAKIRFQHVKSPAPCLHSSQSSHAVTAELTVSQSTQDRERAWTNTTSPQTVIPDPRKLSRQAASAVGVLSRVFLTQKWLSIRMWSRTLDRWWSSNFTCVKDLTVLSEMGLAGAVILTIAQGMRPLAPWQHSARVVLGFSGLLLIDASLGFGAFLFVYDCRNRSWTGTSLSAIKFLLKARSDGKLVRCLREWLQAPWSKDRTLVCQIMHLRKWLQAPWCP